MTAPVVSVILPAYNGAALIGATIDSVLAQDLPDWELVIVDDCSTDDTLAVARAYTDPRIRVIASEVNGGPVVARNLAFAAVRGRYVAGLDQDDLCAPNRFSAQVAYLDRYADTVLVASAALRLQDGRLSPWPGERSLSRAAIGWLLLTQNPLVWSTVMFRTDVARRLDPFERTGVRYAEDFDLYQRLSRFGRIARLDAPLLHYRCHPGGASKMFTARMEQSAAAVLAERYEPLFGARAPHLADLVVRHLMARDAVPDLATLAELSAVLTGLREQHLATTRLSGIERAQIDGEHARLWWLLARPALRQGTVTLGDAIAVRPAGIAVPASNADWLLSPLIGGVRAARRRIGGR